MGILTHSQSVQLPDIESPPLFPPIPQIQRSWVAVGVAFGLGLSGCLLLEMTAIQEAVILLFFVLAAAPLFLIARRAYLFRTRGRDVPDPPSITNTTLAAAFPAGVNLVVTALIYIVGAA